MSVKEVCGNCHYWKDAENGKRRCQKSAIDFTCSHFADNSSPRTCLGCGKYNTTECPFEDCEPADMCWDWQSIEESKEDELENTPTIDKEDVKGLIASGKDPNDILKQLGFSLTDDDTAPSIENTELQVLRYQLNALYKILPGTVLKARIEPTQYNISAVTAVMGQIQSTFEDIHDKEDPRDIYVKIEHEVIDPLTKSFLSSLTTGLNQMNKDLQDHLQDNQKGRVNILFQNTLKTLGPKMQVAMDEHKAELRALLGIEGEDT